MSLQDFSGALHRQQATGDGYRCKRQPPCNTHLSSTAVPCLAVASVLMRQHPASSVMPPPLPSTATVWVRHCWLATWTLAPRMLLPGIVVLQLQRLCMPFAVTEPIGLQGSRAAAGPQAGRRHTCANSNKAQEQHSLHTCCTNYDR